MADVFPNGEYRVKAQMSTSDNEYLGCYDADFNIEA